jgi:hypothetical protein
LRGDGPKTRHACATRCCKLDCRHNRQLPKAGAASCPQLEKADNGRWKGNAGYDPGCVKSRNKITRASQKNRTRRSGEFKMRPVEHNQINVAPEPCQKSFSHNQDPNRSLAGLFCCAAQPVQPRYAKAA